MIRSPHAAASPQCTSGGQSTAAHRERIAAIEQTSCGRARHEWLFRLRFAQSRVAQLDLAPTLAAFASRSVISTPPRFARDSSARARLAVFAETHRLRTSDAERDQGVSRKPSLHAIRESRIASSPRDKMIDSILPALGLCPTLRIVYVAPLPRAPSIRSLPFTSASRLAHLSRSIPIGSVDSTASRILAPRAARPSHRVPRILTSFVGPRISPCR